MVKADFCPEEFCQSLETLSFHYDGYAGDGDKSFSLGPPCPWEGLLVGNTIIKLFSKGCTLTRIKEEWNQLPVLILALGGEKNSSENEEARAVPHTGIWSKFILSGWPPNSKWWNEFKVVPYWWYPLVRSRSKNKPSERFIVSPRP